MTNPRRDEFLFMESDEGDIMLCLPAHEGEPESPKLVVTAEKNGILYRRKKDVVEISGIHPELIDKILSKSDILIGETSSGEDFVRVYEAKIVKADILPNLKKNEA